MKKTIVTLASLTHLAPLICCPTCIGLPRPHERPFFERKSFLAALQQPNAQKQQKPTDKQPQEKTSTNAPCQAE